jgi:hypothetical protein
MLPCQRGGRNERLQNVLIRVGGGIVVSLFGVIAAILVKGG